MTEDVSPNHSDSGQPAETDANRLRQQVVDLRTELETTQTRLKKLEVESFIDSLTGVFNRRAMENDLNQRLAEWQRYGSYFSILLMDFDSLKQVNDDHGHEAGDKLLSEISQLLASKLRRSDLLYRIGGDEFVAILPNTNGEQAQTTAERLCRQTEQHKIDFRQQSITTTISIGIAQVEVNDTFEAILRKADERMYIAKNRGGNQWCRRTVKPDDSGREQPSG